MEVIYCIYFIAIILVVETLNKHDYWAGVLHGNLIFPVWNNFVFILAAAAIPYVPQSACLFQLAFWKQHSLNNLYDLMLYWLFCLLDLGLWALPHPVLFRFNLTPTQSLVVVFVLFVDVFDMRACPIDSSTTTTLIWFYILS